MFDTGVADNHGRRVGGPRGVKRGQEAGGEAQVCGAVPGRELCERVPLQVKSE